ncbi:DUF4244 domain-containing protein [Demequina sp. NBRC 110054]|uniref:DUF4244 domain-containing protein n=1 Tax=Demequina sp. NBRC 110054 TaxID=1570343 RepID=UPI000A0140E1|nr:DUF4244 domain-containing protein [Demequina sp. NBRC 110054]
MADQELQSKGTREVCEAHEEGRWRDDGMATVEYAMVTVAAAAFAGVLAVLVRSDEVRELLAGVIRGAFGG